MQNKKYENLIETKIVNLSKKDYEAITQHDTSNQYKVSSYWYTVISNKKGYRDWSNEYWEDSEETKWPYIGKLFHANSIKTSLDYIKKGYIYSRQKGEELNEQTAQRSDDLDKQLNIYNDIFFDTTDIPYNVGTNTSAYGPIMFVFNLEVIKNKKIRVTRVNPFVDPDLTYDKMYYKSVDDIREGINEIGTTKFLKNTQHHTTLYNTDYVPLKNNLYAIYIEKHRSGDGRESRIRDMIRAALDENGLKGVKTVIRGSYPSNDFYGYANDYDILWEEPAV